MSKGPLAGIRVLDATRALAGPLTTMVLGDLGADVIKLELPGSGDETRFWGPPFVANAGPTFVAYNRNKRSVAIDLHHEEGRQICLDLARSSDVFVENFRPGTMERFHLGYEEMKAVRPDIIYCSISGYGQTGPMAKRPALDLMIQAVSGLMSLTGDPSGRPMKASAPVAGGRRDGRLLAIVAIMGALMERQKTGEGRYLDISMLDGIMTLMGQAVAVRGMSGQSPSRMGNAHPLMAPYESFRCEDREIVIAVTNEKSWAQFAAIDEFKPLATNPGYQTPPLRSQNRRELLTRDRAHFPPEAGRLLDGCAGALGIPVEPINRLDEILDHPQLAERGSVIPVEYPTGSGNWIMTSGMPWRAVAADGPHRNPPDLGETHRRSAERPKERLCKTRDGEMTETYTVADVVAEFLAAARVSTVFGVGSVHNLPLLDGIGRRNAIRFVPTRGEMGAAHMADAYARATDELGVVISSTGPGAANAVGGLLEARMAGTPMLHITSHTNSKYADRHMGTVHEPLDQLGMLESVSKTAYRVRSPHHVLGILARAATDAFTVPTGPVSVEIPIDIQRMPVKRPDTLDTIAIRAPKIAGPSDAELDALAVRILAAKRPVIYFGTGGRNAKAAMLTLLDKGFGMVSSWKGPRRGPRRSSDEHVGHPGQWHQGRAGVLQERRSDAGGRRPHAHPRARRIRHGAAQQYRPDRRRSDGRRSHAGDESVHQCRCGGDARCAAAANRRPYLGRSEIPR